MLNGYPYGYNELQSFVQAYLPNNATLIYDVENAIGLFLQSDLAIQAIITLS